MMAPAYGGIAFGLEADAGRGVLAVTGTIDGGRFTYSVDEAGTLHGPFEGPAEALPLALAELVDLGPRDAPTELSSTLLVEADQLDGVGRDALDRAWDAELRIGTALSGDGWVLWSAWASWNSGEGSEMDGFTVADSGSVIAAVVETEDGVQVQPATSTEVWIALCGLLPRSAELAGAATA